MKKISTIFIALCFPIFSFSQLAFLPVGAIYTYVVSCSGGPPPTYYSFQVTEDTTIQGKYCTRLQDYEWLNNGNTDGRTYVHQDGQKVYRFDGSNQEFKLVLDFSKQVGESWKVEVDEGFFGTDTLTITVTEVLGIYREVSVVGGLLDLGSVPIWEGFGGEYNSRLLVTALWVIQADPSCSEMVTCYQDPEAGVVYGSGQECTTATIDGKNERPILTIYPNPASNYIHCGVSVPSPTNGASLRILDFQGRLVKASEVSPFSAEIFTFPVHDCPAGMYFLQYSEDGIVKGTQKFIVVR